jgi:hypothetical protein
MNLREIGWEGVDWIHMAQDIDQCLALVNMVNKPSGSIECWEFLVWLSNCWLLKKYSAPWKLISFLVI